jgi:hypothetical protein
MDNKLKTVGVQDVGQDYLGGKRRGINACGLKIESGPL